MICLGERHCTLTSLWTLEAVCGSQMMLAYSEMGCTLSMCKLGVWFYIGMCECFCGGRLRLCLLSV